MSDCRSISRRVALTAIVLVAACDPPFRAEDANYTISDFDAPEVTGVVLTPSSVAPSAQVTVEALADDGSLGGSVIVSAAWRLVPDAPSTMAAADGAFDETSEQILATFTAPAADGDYDVCVEATDAAGNTGAGPCVVLSVVTPLVDIDQDGYDSTIDCDDGDPGVHPGATDLPDDGFLDSNCDGIDGDATDAVFVSLAGTDSGTCGPMTDPCATVQWGVNRAAVSGVTNVFVSSGDYTGSISLVDGVSVYGGFDDGTGWARDPVANVSRITGIDGDLEGRAVTLMADGISTAVVADLTLIGPDATGTLPTGQGRSSYVIVVRNSTGGLLLRGNTLRAGAASHGANGTDGAAAAVMAAVGGGAGAGAVELAAACDDASRGTGGAPGASTLAGADGGAGGLGGTMDSDCTNYPLTWDATATAGLPGANADAGPGTGGPGGGACLPGSAGQAGQDGAEGAPGSGAVPNGLLIDGFWHAASAGAGGTGADGSGGGGGGGSGGCDAGTDSYGAGGGGGGAGGAGATVPGSGGMGGGGSFGVYLVSASPAIEANAFELGTAGSGGTGGAAGAGQAGGGGGPGGSGGGTASADAGAGGAGGRGGHSGAGGGGAGGIAAGVYSTAGSAPVLTDNAFSGGSAGSGGAGGLPAGGGQPAGASGAAGSVLNVGSCAAAGAC